PCGQRGGHGPGIVDHQQIARPEVPGQVDELVVAAEPLAAVGDQEPHLVPGQTPGFKRYSDSDAYGKTEQDVHGPHRASTRWARKRQGLAGYAPSAPFAEAFPARPARASSRSMISRTAGATSSGSGRSLMSSPGKAAWCIWVRMSPGSMATAPTPVPASSLARVWVIRSRAALLAP